MHELDVDQISQLISRNMRGASRPMTFFGALVFWSAAVIFTYLATQEARPTLRLMLGVMAAMMLLCAVRYTRAVMLQRTANKPNPTRN
jgi:hypothetical protein